MGTNTNSYHDVVDASTKLFLGASHALDRGVNSIARAFTGSTVQQSLINRGGLWEAYVSNSGGGILVDLGLTIDNVSDAMQWYVGRWFKPSWNEPLPTELPMTRRDITPLNGHPMLFFWRIDILDVLTAFLPAITAAGKSRLMAKGAVYTTGMTRAILSELVRNGAGSAFRHAYVRDIARSYLYMTALGGALGLNRGSDQIPCPGALNNAIVYFSKALTQQHYNAYYTRADGVDVLYYRREDEG